MTFPQNENCPKHHPVFTIEMYLFLRYTDISGFKSNNLLAKQKMMTVRAHDFSAK